MYIVCILNENVLDYMTIGHDCPNDPPVPTAMTQWIEEIWSFGLCWHLFAFVALYDFSKQNLAFADKS